MPLTQDQEDFTHKLDAVGLGLIGTGVVGGLLHSKFHPKLNAGAAEALHGPGWRDLSFKGPAEAPHLYEPQAGWRDALHNLGDKLHSAGPALDLAGLGLITPQAMGYLAKKQHPDVDGDGIPDAPGATPSVAAQKFAAYGAACALRDLGLTPKGR